MRSTLEIATDQAVAGLRQWRRRQSIVLPHPSLFGGARQGVPAELVRDLREAEARGQRVDPMFRSAVLGGIECASVGFDKPAA